MCTLVSETAVEEYTYNPDNAAVILVDGITTALIRGFTPDISWGAYHEWLKRRRPALTVEYLQQPHDWREILTGKAASYSELIETMRREGEKGIHDGIEFAVVFGYSLGGLSALRVAHAIADLEDTDLKYLALVTFGTPFAGTGRLLDPLMRHVHIDYIQSMMDVDEHRELLDGLLERTAGIECRVLLGEIEHDEMVAPGSSLNPAHWLSARPARPGLKWGTFRISTGKLLRAHDGLLHNKLAVSFIDGLLDGLLPEEP